jgi:NitT/TauT family transport system substrate-binding protein
MHAVRNLAQRSVLLLSACLAVLILSACAANPSPQAGDPVTLRIAVIPVLDKLPMYVAQEEGLFARHGVNVEFIDVQSAPERDQLIAAGQADGMVNETVSTIFYNKDNPQVQIVRIAQAATPENALFRIMASKDSGISDAEGLKGVEVAIAEGTVIAYLTDRLLQAEGFTPEEIRTVAVPKITDRMALLDSGELSAAMLPEPLSSLAARNGAVAALDDTSHPEYSYSTIAFRKQVIDEHPEAIRAFLAAVEEAVILINKDPGAWKDLLVEQKLVPEPIIDTFQVSPFATASVPTLEQWEDALAWTQEKGLIKGDVSYESSVNASFLPK